MMLFKMIHWSEWTVKTLEVDLPFYTRRMVIFFIKPATNVMATVSAYSHFCIKSRNNGTTVWNLRKFPVTISLKNFVKSWVSNYTALCIYCFHEIIFKWEENSRVSTLWEPSSPTTDFVWSLAVVHLNLGLCGLWNRKKIDDRVYVMLFYNTATRENVTKLTFMFYNASAVQLTFSLICHVQLMQRPPYSIS